MLWNDAPTLYFHFNAANGLPASLPMTRVLKSFPLPFEGVPGTELEVRRGDAEWIVPGYKCANCQETFFSPTQDGLKHGCMNNGGIISGKA